MDLSFFFLLKFNTELKKKTKLELKLPSQKSIALFSILKVMLKITMCSTHTLYTIQLFDTHNVAYMRTYICNIVF